MLRVLEWRGERIRRPDGHEQQAAGQGADAHDAVLELDGYAAQVGVFLVVTPGGGRGREGRANEGGGAGVERVVEVPERAGQRGLGAEGGGG